MELLGLYIIVAFIVFSFCWLEELDTAQNSIKSAIKWPINLFNLLVTK